MTTLGLLSSATSRTPKWLIKPCTTRVNANIRNTWFEDGEIPKKGRTNCAALKFMPASAAIRPTIFKDATNHAAAPPPSAAAQWYMAPEVGYAEHNSAMLPASNSVNTVATGHPSDISR